MRTSLKCRSGRARRAARAIALGSGALLLTTLALAAAADLSGVWWIRDRSQVAEVDHNTLPLRSEAAAIYRRNREAVAAGGSIPVGQRACLPEGMPRLMLARYPLQILQRPEQITILHERMHMVRFVYLDRPLREDPEPTFTGESVGRWEGDTLVVRTIALRPDSVIDGTGIPHSDAMTLLERFSLRDAGKTLRDEVTVDDPKTFTKRWRFRIDYDRRPEVRLMEDVCTFGPPQRDSVKP